MSNPTRKPITIVGGGLAGLTLGIALRQRAVPVVLMEAASYPRHRVCGEFISGSGQEVLARLGLLDLAFKAGAQPVQDAMFFAGTRCGPVRHLRKAGYAVSRFALDAALAARFQVLGGDLRENSRWQDEYGEGVVRATGRRVQKAECDWRWFGLKVHARNVRLDAGLEMHSLPDGYVGLCRLGGGEVNVCGLFRNRRTRGESSHSVVGQGAGVRRAAAVAGGGYEKALTKQSEPRGDVKEAWKQILRGGEGTLLHERLAGASFAEASFCSVGGLYLKPQVRLTPGECRIGDALTMTPPVTGNGMSMAFEAAELAIEPLAAYSTGSVSWESAQQAVAEACRRVFGSRLAWARLLQWMMFAPVVRNCLSGACLNSGLLWHTLFAKTR